MKKLKTEWTPEAWAKTAGRSQRQEWAATDPLAWVLEYQPLIRLPNVGEIPFRPCWAQQVMLRDKHDQRALNKMRQGGFSTVFSASECVHDMLYAPAPDIIVISKSEKEAKGFLKKFYLAYDSIKDKDPNWSPLIKRNTFDAENKRGGTISIFTSSKSAGRSFSASRVYFDEIAHAQYADGIYTSSYPTIRRTGGQITVFSTPNGPQGKFYEICDDYRAMGYTYHEYPWWFVPFYNSAYEQFMKAFLSGDKAGQKRAIEKGRQSQWYKQTYAALGELDFMQEYECNFDANTTTQFTRQQLNNVFVKNYLHYYPDEYGEVWRAPGYPKENHDYITYTDYGRRRDPLVTVTMDISEFPAKVVEYKRITPLVFGFDSVKKSIKETIRRFGSEAYHDGLGAGEVLTAYLDGWSEPKEYGDSPFSKPKTKMIEKLRLACDISAIVMPKITQIYKEFKGYKMPDKGLVQDCVMAIGGCVDQFFEPEEDAPHVDDVSYVGQ